MTSCVRCSRPIGGAFDRRQRSPLSVSTARYRTRPWVAFIPLVSCLARNASADDLASAIERPVAAESGLSPDPPNVTAEIHVIGNRVDFDNLRDVVGSNRIGTVEVAWSRQERLNPESLLEPLADHEPKVRCWIDFSHPGMAQLYFADRTSKRFLLRQVAISRNLNEIEKETLAQVIEFSIAALTDDTTPSLSRNHVEALLGVHTPDGSVSAPRMTAPFVTYRQASTRVEPLIGAGYQIESFSTPIPWLHGPTATFGILRQTREWLGSARLHVGYQVPESYSTDLVGVRLSALRLRGSLGLAVPIVQSDSADAFNVTTLGVEAGAGANAVFVQPLRGSLGQALVIESNKTVWVPCLDVEFHIGRIWRSWFVAVGGHAQYDLEPVSYDVRDRAATTSLLRPYRLRPSLHLEFGAF